MCKICLNKEQKTAVEHNFGPMLVLSGPGSGKTTVILNRIKYLIEVYNVNPKDILTITFTKSSCEEIKSRFYLEFSKSYYNVSFVTFHSCFFKIIKNYYNYSLENILNEKDKIKIVKNIIKEENIVFDNEEEYIQNIISNISLLKNELINPKRYIPYNCTQSEFLTIYNVYEKNKNFLNKIDFDDMLVKCYNLLKNNDNVRSFWSNRFKYILIDEFQDINRVQYEIVKILTCETKNIFVVGDDDQSIYKFRGSRPDFLLNFSKDFKNAKKVILNINYRSTDEIINLCNKIINDNKNRYSKNILGTGKKYKKPILIRPKDTADEAKFIIKKIQKLKKYLPLEEIAILYRTNIQSIAIIEALRDANIQYQVKDEIFSIYEHWIFKDILSYLLLALDLNENKHFLNIVNKPKRYINKSLIEESLKFCNRKNKSIINYIYNLDDIKNYQVEKLDLLLFQLKEIKGKSTYDAVKYIIKNVGYENYLQEYADFKKIKVKGLYEILYEILESSKKFSNILDYLNYTEEMKVEIKDKNKDNDLKGVVLSTIHSIKGLEFETVFLISCVEGVIPHEKSKTEEEIEEERRLLYVGLTRAKRILYISTIKCRHEQKLKQSRFLNKIIKN